MIKEDFTAEYLRELMPKKMSDNVEKAIEKSQRMMEEAAKNGNTALYGLRFIFQIYEAKQFLDYFKDSGIEVNSKKQNDNGMLEFPMNYYDYTFAW